MFDPNKLNEAQKNFLLTKIAKSSGHPDADGCIKYIRKSRQGKLGTVGSMKLEKEIASLFGSQDVGMNPATLLYSLTNMCIITKNSNVECSHVCGYSLCLNINHIIFESKEYNNSRTSHHREGRCFVVDHVQNPPCIFKTVKPDYSK